MDGCLGDWKKVEIDITCILNPLPTKLLKISLFTHILVVTIVPFIKKQSKHYAYLYFDFKRPSQVCF